MMKKYTIRLLPLLVLIISLNACKKDKENPVPVINYHGDAGAFVVHEGAYAAGNASISFINRSNGALQNNLYSLENNNVPLGDVAQSMTIFNGKGYIVVNNSQKVEVVTFSDFKNAGTIKGLASPRYMLGIDSSKAYISDWNDNNLKIVNLNTLAISGNIATGTGPEQMVKVNGFVYVANNGGYGLDSTVTVISIATNLPVDTIKVGDKPTALKVDKNNNIWVLCSGDYGASFTTTTDDTPARLVKISPSSNSVVSSFTIGAQGDHPGRLAINSTNDVLYYENTGIFKFAITDVALPSLPLIAKTNGFYGLDVDPLTDIIYAADAKDFQQKGQVYRYNSSGVAIDNFQVGVAPSSFSFR
jgi:hypothetical protein